MFHFPAQNIDCGYSSEPPRRGGSNEYPQSMFLSRNKKNNVYPCKLQLYYIKVGLRGSKLYRHVFMMPILNASALAMVIVWWFMSPLALFKSYWDNGEVTTKTSVQWNSWRLFLAGFEPSTSRTEVRRFNRSITRDAPFLLFFKSIQSNTL